MELLDFLEFASFNRLRQQIGTDKLGYFELFDPHRHLTGDERSILEEDGYLISYQQLHTAGNKTLAYKNSRVLAYVPETEYYQRTEQYPHYHLAYCPVLYQLIQLKPDMRLQISTRVDSAYPLFSYNNDYEVLSRKMYRFTVCKYCLHTTAYKGYSALTNRKREYSHNLLLDFSLEEFFNDFPVYPLDSARPDSSINL